MRRLHGISTIIAIYVWNCSRKSQINYSIAMFRVVNRSGGACMCIHLPPIHTPVHQPSTGVGLLCTQAYHYTASFTMLPQPE